MKIGIAGAGLLGRLLAWRLAQAGHAVSVFDPAPGPGARYGQVDGQPQAAAYTAAGMLSPLAELDNAGPEIAVLGWRSIALWRDIVAQLPQQPFFSARGSLLLAHRPDLGAAQRVLARLTHPHPALMNAPQAQTLSPSDLAGLEPSIQGPTHAWLLPGEGQIDPPSTLDALQANARGVQWHWSSRARDVRAAGQGGAITLEDGAQHHFDQVFDVRGVGARPDLPVRGVRGETVWLYAPGHGLNRPVRLLHPRHRVYLVPRPGDVVVVGASEIESEDRSPVSLRSAVELMAAAHSLMPALAEARIVRMDHNLRPALPDNDPRVVQDGACTRINGLFRHGWLLAPALVDNALQACGLAERGLNENSVVESQ